MKYHKINFFWQQYIIMNAVQCLMYSTYISPTGNLLFNDFLLKTNCSCIKTWLSFMWWYNPQHFKNSEYLWDGWKQGDGSAIWHLFENFYKFLQINYICLILALLHLQKLLGKSVTIDCWDGGWTALAMKNRQSKQQDRFNCCPAN